MWGILTHTFHEVSFRLFFLSIIKLIWDTAGDLKRSTEPSTIKLSKQYRYKIEKST